MPTAMAFTADAGDPTVGEVRIGTGTVGSVQARVWDYAVGGRNVLGSWFGYRRANPAGRRSSPLDDINATTWPAGPKDRRPHHRIDLPSLDAT